MGLLQHGRMTRFLDAIIANHDERREHWHWPRPEGWQGEWADDMGGHDKDVLCLTRVLMDDPVIACDNVAKFCWDGAAREQTDISLLPTVMPPFDRFSMEYDPPHRQKLPTGEVADVYAGLRWVGAVFGLYDAPEGYLMTAAIATQDTDGRLAHEWPKCMIPLDKNGKVTDFFVTLPDGMDRTDPRTDVIVAMMKLLLLPMLMAISFMNCSNVKRVMVQPTTALDKSRKKKGKRPLFRYHVLEIKPLEDALRAAGSAGDGMGKALHLCRGHFVHLEHERYTGPNKLIWRRQHLRGSIANGVIAKDYSVAAPRSAS